MSFGLPLLLDGRYRLTEVIGRGGHATVFRGSDELLGRDVAVKVLRDENAASDLQARFLQEIQITSRLEHSHILHVYDTGVHNGAPFVVMEFVNGESLAARLIREPQLPIDDVLEIAREIGSALAHAHTKGVVHRDVKPENILLGPGGAILADFGVARITQSDLGQRITSTGAAVGTLVYMSPEQLCAEPNIDARSDQYSFACVLYEMIAGQRPHIAPTFEGLRMLRMSGSYTPLRTLRAKTPSTLDDAIRVALSPAAADRFRSVKDFLAAVGAMNSRDFAIVASNALPMDAAAVGSSGPFSATGSSGRPHTRRTFIPRDKSRFYLFGAVVTAIALALIGTAYFSTLPAPPIHEWSLGESKRNLPVAISYVNLGSDPSSVAFGSALRAELGRWKGIDTVSTIERRDALGLTLVPSVHPFGDSARVRVELRTGNGDVVRALDSQVSSAILSSENVAEFAHARVIESLALRADIEGNVDVLRGALALKERSWSALRQYVSGLRAIRLGRLDQARAVFDSSATNAPLFTYARFWSAQSAAWADTLHRGEWRETLEEVPVNALVDIRDSIALAALRAMSLKDYPTACESYRRLSQVDRKSFVAAYGLGRCLVADRAVLQTPSGFMFRTSANAAVIAFDKAIAYAESAELLGALFGPIMKATYARSGQARPGIGPSPLNVRFNTMPSKASDSLAFFPKTESELAKSPPPDSWDAALALGAQWAVRLAQKFHDRWPNSAEGWYWFARALELSGKLANTGSGPSAAQALDSAASKKSIPISLRASIQSARASVAIREGNVPAAYLIARQSVDSVRSNDPQVRAILLPLAAFIGDLDAAERLRDNDVTDSTLSGTVQSAIGRFSLRSEMGVCDVWSDSLDALTRFLNAQLSSAQMDTAIADLTLPLRAGSACARGATQRLFAKAIASDSALNLLFKGENARAAEYVRRNNLTRIGSAPASITWDAIFRESWILASAGDTASARQRLTTALNGISKMSYFTFVQSAQSSGLRRGIQLLASIASDGKSSTEEQKWIKISEELWPTTPPKQSRK